MSANVPAPPLGFGSLAERSAIPIYKLIMKDGTTGGQRWTYRPPTKWTPHEARRVPAYMERMKGLPVNRQYSEYLLCTAAYFHGYLDPLQAIFGLRQHVDEEQNVLWQGLGWGHYRIQGDKAGFTHMKLTKRLGVVREPNLTQRQLAYELLMLHDNERLGIPGCFADTPTIDMVLDGKAKPHVIYAHDWVERADDLQPTDVISALSWAYTLGRGR